ncbi:leucyl aminopeptidase [Corynebacterium urealyticum]|uniref:leucyl aminopeptidase n=1 Tax=Corynebacterium urealyticum TaxID=43771 RepID=UPI0002B3FD11|nr:leucyl aminopeptidase [Corynebacterium urealyticum]AGE36818.1 putative aminopeptidase [Corynebacterium urealyticum DSM 7111]QQB08439.1 leucyl aminopeptidase [Corynebacterium urealyticum]
MTTQPGQPIALDPAQIYSALPNRGTMPTIDLVAELPADAEVDTLIVPVFQGANGLELAATGSGLLSKEQEITLWRVLTSVGATGKREELTPVPGELLATEGSAPATKILALGLGDIDESTDEDIRELAGVASRAAGLGSKVVSSLGLISPEAALVGHALGGYRFAGFKGASAKDAAGQDASAKDDAAASDSPVTITVLAREADADLLAQAQVDAAAVALARDFVNTPANFLYPETYANTIREIAEAVGLGVEILDEKELEEKGYGGIVGVGKGSEHAPRLVRLTHEPSAKNEAPQVALVGKGVTFDTGGISLKPGANMWDMISDMGGSAAVVATMVAAARLDLPMKVIATIPLAENTPSSTATRPGDVLRHYNGLTTEVLNTDAEGRLILADAMARACEDEPDYLIETATLTGAQMVALGNRTPGVMGSIAFRDKVAELSQEIGENGWAMPLPPELGEALKSDVADLRNISASRWGGMSVAGHYLANFVTEGVEWVHIDIAGPAYNTEGAFGYTPKRGTGVPVRTILATLRHLAGTTKEG